MGSKNGKNAKNRNRKLIFQPEVPKKAYFRFRFLNFQGFTLLFWQKVGRIWPFLANFLGISTGSSFTSTGSGPKSAEFSKFSRLHALCGKKFWKLATGNGNRVQKCLKTLVLWKNARFLAKSCEILPQETEMASKNA